MWHQPAISMRVDTNFEWANLVDALQAWATPGFDYERGAGDLASDGALS
jgi:hypothetical protein